MSLSNKKIKYIKNTFGQKTIKDLSIELNVSEKDIEEILKDFSENKPTHTRNISQGNINNETIISGHTLLVLIQAILIFSAPLVSKDSSWYDFANLAQELYVQSISGFMLLIWLLDCVISKKFEIKKSKLYLPIICILAWSIISLSWTTNKPESIEIISQWVACGIIFFVIYNMVRNSLDSSILFFAFMCSLSYLVSIGLVQFFDNTFSWYNQVISPAGTFGNKNMFSDYLVIVLPICFYFFMTGSDRTRLVVRIFAGTVFVGGILLIVFSRTRSGMITFPILFSLFILLVYLLKIKATHNSEIFSKQKKTLLILFLLLFPCIMVLYMSFGKEGFKVSDYKARIKSIFVLPDQDLKTFNKEIKDENLTPASDSTSIRLIAWRNTLEMIKAKPLQGFGLNNWQIHYADYRRAYYNDPTYQPGLILAQLHNDYIQIAVEQGLVGFALFAWLIISVLISFKKLFFSQQDTLEVRLKAMSLFLCLVGFGIACSFSFLLVKAVPTFLLFIYMAIIANLFYHSKLNQTNLKPVYSFRHNFAAYFLIPVLAVSIYVTKIELIRGEADQLFKTANDEFIQQNYDAVITTCEKLLKVQPNLNKTHFILGNAYMSVNRYEEAVKEIEIALEYYPNDLMGLFQAGTINIRQLKTMLESNVDCDKNEIKRLEDKTIYWYDRAFKIRHDFGKAWNNLGYLYERRAYRFDKEGKKEDSIRALKEAENCFDNAMSQDPNYSDAVLNKANILLTTDRLEEAQKYALKVLKKTAENFKEKDKKLKELDDQNFQKSTGTYNNAVTQRVSATQEYLTSGPKAIQILKAIYGKNKNYKDLIEIFENEKNFIILTAETQAIRTNHFISNLEMARKDSGYLRKGMNIEQLQNIVEVEKNANKKAEKEAHYRMALLLHEVAENYRNLNQQEDAIITLQKIIELGKTSEIADQVTYAHFKIIDFYLGVVNQDSPNKFPLIEEHFKQANFIENNDLNNMRAALLQKYNQVKLTFKNK